MKKNAFLGLILAGLGAGVVNGLFGAGGGMVLVPLLIGFAHLEDKQAFSSAKAIQGRMQRQAVACFLCVKIRKEYFFG